MFTLKIETDNDAFQDGMAGYEVARILEIVVAKLGQDYTSGPLYDANGNAVGSWELS